VIDSAQNNMLHFAILSTFLKSASKTLICYSLGSEKDL